MTVNCAVVAASLIESELFGHARGAFTGADRARAGHVEAAGSGSLFLDEVGDLPLSAQGKLLRLLEEREYVRVGDTDPRRSDARVIAATLRDLRGAVAAGTFREDLFYRLNVVSVTLPPLRERVEDLPDLAQGVVNDLAAQHRRESISLSPSAMRALLAYRWPGNLRELSNVLERAVILAEGAEITPDLLPEELRASSPASPTDDPGDDTLESAERRHIAAVLARCALPRRGREGPRGRPLDALPQARALRAAMSPSLRARLTLGLALIAAALLVMSAVALRSLHDLGGAVDRILRENYRSVIACGEMLDALERQDSAAMFAAAGRDDLARPMLRANRDAFARALAVEAGNITLPGEGELVSALRAGYDGYTRAVDAALAAPGHAARRLLSHAAPALRGAQVHARPGARDEPGPHGARRP